jgi:energy-converting hydrogenase A subunit M
VGSLDVMTTPKNKTAALALAGAVALASGAYALGSQSDGSAVASGEDGRPAFAHRGGPEFGLDRLADRLGVDEDKLRDALADVRDDLPARRELHADFAKELADELGTTEAKVEAALERIRAKHEQQFEQRRDALAEALAKRLNLDAAKVKEALETPRFFFKRPGP